MKQLLIRGMKQLPLMLRAYFAYLVVGIVIGFFFGIRVLVVGLFLVTVAKVLRDWFKRGKDYIRASRSNYLCQVLIDVILIIVVECLYLLPDYPILVLAVPLIAISLSFRGSGWQRLGIVVTVLCLWIAVPLIAMSLNLRGSGWQRLGIVVTVVCLWSAVPLIVISLRFHLRGWQRLGIVVCVLWAMGAGGITYLWYQSSATTAYESTYDFCLEDEEVLHHTNSPVCGDKAWNAYRLTFMTGWKTAALVALVPISVGWLLTYTVVRIWRWVQHRFAHNDSRHSCLIPIRPSWRKRSPFLHEADQ